MAALLATVAAVALLLGARPKSHPGPATTTSTRPTARAAVAPPEAYPVGRSAFTVVDPSRKARVGGAYVPRSLAVTVWYPEPVSGTGARFPLVAFAPGYLQCPEQYAPLLEAWAAAGYVVAGIRFPATNCSSPPGGEGDVVNQPADVELVTSRLTEASSGTPADAEVDPARVAVAGHSDGGDVAAVVAAGTCCRDGHVGAAVVLAGAELASFGGTYFPPGTPPLLVVQGMADSVNAPAAGQALFAGDGAGPKWLLSLPGGTHFAPYQGGGPYEQVVARVTSDFLRLTLSGDDAAGQAMSADGTVAGIASLSS